MNTTKKFFNSNTLWAIVVMTLSVHLVYVHYELSSTASRLEALVQAWETTGPQATLTGRLRARLAGLTWLGQLRPDALRDPFRECGVPRASNGWWSGLVRLKAARRRFACLEDHMSEAKAEHLLFEERVRDLCMLGITLTLACVVAFLPKGPQDGEDQEVLHEEARPSGPPQTGSSASTESSGSSFDIIEAPPPGAGHSRSREVVVRIVGLPKLQRSCIWPVDMTRYSSRTISCPRRLREDMGASFFLQRRRNAGKLLSFLGVGYDSLDVWRGADKGKGKEAVLLEQRQRDWFRPSCYPRPPHPKSCVVPFEVLPRRDRPLSLETPQHEARGSPASWEVVLLQAVPVFLLVYLCYRDATR